MGAQTARRAQKDEEADEVIRQRVEAGIAADRLARTGEMATNETLIERLGREVAQ